MRKLLVAMALLLVMTSASFAANENLKIREVKQIEVNQKKQKIEDKKIKVVVSGENKTLYISDEILKQLGFIFDYIEKGKELRVVAVQELADLTVVFDGKDLKSEEKQKPILYQERIYVSANALNTLFPELKFKDNAKNDKDAKKSPKINFIKQKEMMLSHKDEELKLNDESGKELDLIILKNELYLPLKAFAVQIKFDYPEDFKYKQGQKNQLVLTVTAEEKKEEQPKDQTGSQTLDGAAGASSDQSAINKEEKPDKGTVDEKLAQELAEASDEFLKSEIPYPDGKKYAADAYSKTEWKKILLRGDKSNQEASPIFFFWNKHIRTKNISIATAEAALEKMNTDWKEIARNKAQIIMREGSISKVVLLLTLMRDENFTEDESLYAVENIKIDWKEKALAAGKNFSEKAHPSKGQLEKMLKKAQFKDDEVSYAMSKITANWNEHALNKAELLIEGGLKRETLYEVLINQNNLFTPEEARYAVDNLRR